MSGTHPNNDMSEKFSEVAKLVSSYKDMEISNEIKLELYGLYKRATVGKCSEHGTKPWAWEMEASMKYEAWNKNEFLSPTQCMSKYISIVEDLQTKLDKPIPSQ